MYYGFYMQTYFDLDIYIYYLVGSLNIDLKKCLQKTIEKQYEHDTEAHERSYQRDLKMLTKE